MDIFLKSNRRFVEKESCVGKGILYVVKLAKIGID